MALHEEFLSAGIEILIMRESAPDKYRDICQEKG
jgi:hypothetical protein